MPGKWDALKTHGISAQDFKDPLLLALATLTNYQAGVSVECDATYDPVCKAMGLTLTQYGKPESADVYWVERWIQEAFKALIRFNLANRTGRGQWCLTEKGVERAHALNSPAQSKTESPMLELASPSIPFEANYHEDPYIRALAIKETPCFGLYSPTGHVCIDCVFQFNCIMAQSAEFSRLNQELLTEESDAYKKAAAQEQAEALAKDKPAPAPKVNLSVEKKGGRVITAQVEASCAKCGKTITLGSKAVWVKSNTANNINPGMYHEECFDKI